MLQITVSSLEYLSPYLHDSSSEMCHSSIVSYTCTVYWLLRIILAAHVLEDGDVTGSSVTDAKDMPFFFIFAVNGDSGTHPKIFLGIILPQNSSQNVCDSNVSQDRASTDAALPIKRVWSFSKISQRTEILAHITCCSLG